MNKKIARQKTQLAVKQLSKELINKKKKEKKKKNRKPKRKEDSNVRLIQRARTRQTDRRKC